jgi:uncharacterized membrane protein YfcA
MDFANDVHSISLLYVIILTIASFLVGIFGGFVGLALGTIRLPIMLLLGIPPEVAGGTNILVSSLASLSGTIRHVQAGRVRKDIILAMGVPAVIGSLLGGFSSDVLPERLLITAAGMLVAWQGIEFVAMSRGWLKSIVSTGVTAFNENFSRKQLSLEGGIGLTVGFVGGAVGLILGSIRLPALIRILRVDPKIAAGSNLFIGFFMGISGWFGHVFMGHVDYKLLICMGSGAIIGSYIGAYFTGKANLNVLIATMGAVLFIAGVLLIVSAYR